MKIIKRFWRYLGRWDIIIGYLISVVFFFIKGNHFNNGITDIRYVYFFNISGVLILIIMIIKILEKFWEKNKDNE